ncbi:unnamed protein product [Urochloa humidicola]
MAASPRAAVRPLSPAPCPPRVPSSPVPCPPFLTPCHRPPSLPRAVPAVPAASALLAGAVPAAPAAPTILMEKAPGVAFGAVKKVGWCCAGCCLAKDADELRTDVQVREASAVAGGRGGIR